MAERNSFRASSTKFRARQDRRRAAKRDAEEQLWASKSGPVRIYHVSPESLRDRPSA